MRSKLLLFYIDQRRRRIEYRVLSWVVQVSFCELIDSITNWLAGRLEWFWYIFEKVVCIFPSIPNGLVTFDTDYVFQVKQFTKTYLNGSWQSVYKVMDYCPYHKHFYTDHGCEKFTNNLRRWDSNLTQSITLVLTLAYYFSFDLNRILCMTKRMTNVIKGLSIRDAITDCNYIASQYSSFASHYQFSIICPALRIFFEAYCLSSI